MPSPSTSLATLRPEFQSLLEFDLAMDRAGFIWSRVCPVFEVGKSAGTFGRIPVAQLLQNRSTNRTSDGGYSRGKWTFTTDSYATTEYGAEEPVDDREEALYASYFDAELIAAQRALDVVLRNAERRIADLIFNATTWTGASLTTSVSTPWDDLDSSTPLDDVEAAVRAVWASSGIWPNALVINRHVFRNLRNNVQVIERITASGAGQAAKPTDVTTSMLAQCFDLDQIIVAGGTKNAATEGQPISFGKIWSDEYAMVCKVATSNDIREPSVGRVFHWGEDGSSVGGTVEMYRDERVRADITRVRHDVAEKVMYKETGHLLSNITT